MAPQASMPRGDATAGVADAADVPERKREEQQLHATTIIEVAGREHQQQRSEAALRGAAPLDENELRPLSNRKERLAEVLLNEQNASASAKAAHNNRVIQELKAAHADCLPPAPPAEGRSGKSQKEGAAAAAAAAEAAVAAPAKEPAQNGVADAHDAEEAPTPTPALPNGVATPEAERALPRPRRVKDDEVEERLGRRPTTEVLVTVFEEEQEDDAEVAFCRSMTESFTSTVSTPDTVVCPSTVSCGLPNGTPRRTMQSQQAMQVSPDAAVSPFHERTSSKDVIDELNRMIRKGEDTVSGVAGPDGDTSARLDVACCCPTGWVHVERDIDFTDPKARANLLDVMLASSGSSGNSSGSSTGGGSGSSSSSESGEEPADYQHLHRLHRFRRQKKASATREQLGVLRYPASAPRPSILGRDDFYVRYGDKEREAVASFDFLEDLSTTSVSGASSCDTLGSHNRPPLTPVTAPSSTQPSAGTTPSSPEDCSSRCSGLMPSVDSVTGTTRNYFSSGIETGEL